ncbi:aldehyde dehydrogenase [Woeseia oceani]|uniref:Aldehyde dehydrogenase PuuC n=1 Tax=Woeseia oceani TaxID=1548547 RepID=A0A193LCA4_9GAMM|nr:aldehyde dehydrogenase [Woeseia oceani]ANO50165.1 aldehyde dehydrogenase PuuC [Woeseia oceani]
MSIEALKQYSYTDWKKAAQRELAALETRHFIGGEFVDSLGGGRFDTVNPANQTVLASMAAAAPKDVDRAVAVARKAFRSGSWSRIAPRERMAVMYRFARLIEEHAERLALLDTLDMGKPIADMLEVDIPSVVDTVQFMAEYIDKIEGSVTSTEHDVTHFVLREPLGVVAAISPWNYPLLMAAWKIAPALSAGNTVVLKPAEQAPLSCLRLAELFVEAGGPPGVFNVINGIGEVTGKALALHNDVDKVTFTGSTEVGKLMLQYAGQSNMKKVSLECGGKSPQVFMADLPDLDAAVAAAYNGIFANMGEVCNAGSRLLVEQSIHEEFVERFVAEGKSAYIAGDPLDPETSLGPLVTAEAQQRVLAMIRAGKKEGAQLVFGGDVPEMNGSYINPTLFTGVSNTMRIAREEIFGPVAAIIPFTGIDEAVHIANDTMYGLAAGIWTRDINRAHRLIRELEAGVIWVNCFDEGDMTQPFGGYNQSGNARDKCVESLLSYTQTKSAWIRHG